MNSQDAHARLTQALALLTEVRNELGEALCASHGQLNMKDPKVRRQSELHDRAAHCIAAYHAAP